MCSGEAARRTAAGRLVGSVREVRGIVEVERNQMFCLMDRYFDNVRRKSFERDLAEKEWAILLNDAETKNVRGFSTLMRIRTDIDGEPLVALYSGDTVIDHRYRGQKELQRVWLRHVFRVARLQPAVRHVWFFVTSSFRSYCLMPSLFRDCYPANACGDESQCKRRLDTLCVLRFGAAYDSNTGIVRRPDATPLRFVDSRQVDTSADSLFRWFTSMNPAHAAGDELACLAEIRQTNLTDNGRQLCSRPD